MAGLSNSAHIVQAISKGNLYGRGLFAGQILARDLESLGVDRNEYGSYPGYTIICSVPPKTQNAAG
jgi:hypothetical protein